MAKADQASTEVAEKARPYMKLMDDLKGIAQLDAAQGAGFEVAANVIDAITQAASLDDIFAANEQGPAKAEDYVGIPLNPFDVSWHKSAEKFAKGSLGVYGVLRAFTDNGEEVTLSCGAPNVVASWRAMQLLGAINKDNPAQGRHKLTATETANGTLLRVGKA